MANVAKMKRFNSCDTCGKCFAKPALLRRHLVVHSTEKPFACDSCASCFSQKSSLQRHKRMKHNVAEERDDSAVAQHALAALKLLQDHHTSADLEAPFELETRVEATLEEQPICELALLKDKLRPNGEVHLVSAQRIRRPKCNRCYYVCEYCAKEFSRSYDLIRHRRTHTKETPYPCNRCLKRFATQAKLNEHRRRQHATLQRDAISQLQHHPNLMRAADPQLARLRQPLPQPVLTERGYKCVYCARQFMRKFNCRCHMLRHVRRLLTMRHSCLQCGKHFTRPNDLARHLLTHSKLKLHICRVCQKRFTLKSTLARHLATHQAQRSSVNCQVCGKSYASRASLRLHLRLHTGERPFRCEICGETFRTSGHRLEHVRGERHKNAKNALLL